MHKSTLWFGEQILKPFFYFMLNRRYEIRKKKLIPAAKSALVSLADNLNTQTHISRLHRVNGYLKGFTYKEDRMDYAQKPYLFWISKEGGCEDYALFACELLHIYMPCWYMTVHKKSEGHGVCVIQNPNGTYSHISNWSVIRNCFVNEYPTLNELARSILPTWEWYVLREYNYWKVISICMTD